MGQGLAAGEGHAALRAVKGLVPEDLAENSVGGHFPGGGLQGLGRADLGAGQALAAAGGVKNVVVRLQAVSAVGTDGGAGPAADAELFLEK